MGNYLKNTGSHENKINQCKTEYVMELEKLGFKSPIGYFNKALILDMWENTEKAGMTGNRNKTFMTPITSYFNVGAKMEGLEKDIKAITKEIEDAKKEMEESLNQFNTLFGILHPKLIEEIKQIRDTRITIMTEMREMLGKMSEVRKFFLESDYEKEIERLEKFIGLCKEMKELDTNGTLDAVCTMAIKMALKEEEK